MLDRSYIVPLTSLNNNHKNIRETIQRISNFEIRAQNEHKNKHFNCFEKDEILITIDKYTNDTPRITDVPIINVKKEYFERFKINIIDDLDILIENITEKEYFENKNKLNESLFYIGEYILYFDEINRNCFDLLERIFEIGLIVNNFYNEWIKILEYKNLVHSDGLVIINKPFKSFKNCNSIDLIYLSKKFLHRTQNEITMETLENLNIEIMNNNINGIFCKRIYILVMCLVSLLESDYPFNTGCIITDFISSLVSNDKEKYENFVGRLSLLDCKFLQTKLLFVENICIQSFIEFNIKMAPSNILPKCKLNHSILNNILYSVILNDDLIKYLIESFNIKYLDSTILIFQKLFSYEREKAEEIYKDFVLSCSEKLKKYLFNNNDNNDKHADCLHDIQEQICNFTDFLFIDCEDIDNKYIDVLLLYKKYVYKIDILRLRNILNSKYFYLVSQENIIFKTFIEKIRENKDGRDIKKVIKNTVDRKIKDKKGLNRILIILENFPKKKNLIYKYFKDNINIGANIVSNEKIKHNKIISKVYLRDESDSKISISLPDTDTTCILDIDEKNTLEISPIKEKSTYFSLFFTIVNIFRDKPSIIRYIPYFMNTNTKEFITRVINIDKIDHFYINVINYMIKSCLSLKNKYHKKNMKKLGFLEENYKIMLDTLAKTKEIKTKTFFKYMAKYNIQMNKLEQIFLHQEQHTHDFYKIIKDKNITDTTENPIYNKIDIEYEKGMVFYDSYIKFYVNNSKYCLYTKYINYCPSEKQEILRIYGNNQIIISMKNNIVIFYNKHNNKKRKIMIDNEAILSNEIFLGVAYYQDRIEIYMNHKKYTLNISNIKKLVFGKGLKGIVK
ncbi:hypothetical protein SLOPH_1730, partial [Spraguea lophii 42_110]